jgi:hypothetical protein
VYVGVASDEGNLQAVSPRPARCHPRCRIIATPDVNGDGIADIAVGQRGVAAYFSLFIIQLVPRLAVTAVHRSSGGVLEFSVGGTIQSMGGLVCLTGSVIQSWSAAETAEGAGPYDVEVRRYRLKGSRATELSRSHALVAQGEPTKLPEEGGVAFGASKGVCGARFLSPSSVAS